MYIATCAWDGGSHKIAGLPLFKKLNTAKWFYPSLFCAHHAQNVRLATITSCLEICCCCQVLSGDLKLCPRNCEHLAGHRNKPYILDDHHFIKRCLTNKVGKPEKSH